MARSKTTTFVSTFYEDIRIVKVPGRPESRDVSNRIISDRVPTVDAQFKGGRYETDDQEMIEFLRNHEIFNTPRGIWEEGNAPDEPKPTTASQHKAIVKLTAKSDVDGLRELVAEERDLHNRRDVISTAEEAISNIEVPLAEEHGAIGRADEPAEAGGLPKVDPVDEPSKLQPEVEREKVLKSETVAQGRADAVEADKVEDQLEAEAGASTAEETEKAAPKKKPAAKKRPAKKKPAAAASEGASQSTANGKNDGDTGKSDS